MSPKRTATAVTTDRLMLAMTGLVIVAVLGVAAWSATYSAANDPPTVDRNITERYGAIEYLNATRTTAIKRDRGETSRAVYDMTLAPATGERRLRLAGGGSKRYDLRISNGSVLWLHDTERMMVTRIPLADPPADGELGGRVQRLLVRAGLTVEDSGPKAPSVEPLPVVPDSPGGETAPAPAANYEVAYAGTETIDSRETYVLNITARSNSSATYRQTLWIDTEWLYPLQQQTVWSDNGVRTQLTTTYTDVQFNPSVPDGTFRPDISQNTTVESVQTPDTETYSGLSALQSDTDIAVPSPDIPVSYELIYATHTTGKIRGVSLRYVNRTSSLTISKYNFTYLNEDSSENITVDGRPTTLSVGPTTSLSWNCDTYRYTVRGSGVTTDRLVVVARSVSCPG